MTTSMTIASPLFAPIESRPAGMNRSMWIELALWCVLIAGCNSWILCGGSPLRLVLLPSAAASGDWWRWFTHPFVHVSAYHLILDAVAFLSLYSMLTGRRVVERLLLVMGCGIGSLLAALAAAPGLEQSGFCGLSGVAHGLMAVVGLDWAVDREGIRGIRWMGWVCLMLVLAKSAIEAATGLVVLDGAHWGSVGEPIAACHAGGVMGGILVWRLLFVIREMPEFIQIDQSPVPRNRKMRGVAPAVPASIE